MADKTKPYTFDAANSLGAFDTDSVVAKSLGNNYGALQTGAWNQQGTTANPLLNQAGVPTNIAIENASKFQPEGNWYDAFSKDGGLLGASQIGLGIGGLGLGVANYLDATDTAKLNRQLMNQQIANNKTIMADKEANKAAMERVFAPRAPGGGLGQASPGVVPKVPRGL